MFKPQLQKHCHKEKTLNGKSFYICIAVFGAWVKHKNIFNCVIFKENIAIFAEIVFVTKNFVIDQTFTINLLSYTKTLVPIYRFRAITFFIAPK